LSFHAGSQSQAARIIHEPEKKALKDLDRPQLELPLRQKS
jgi:hypothetical protein